MNLIVFSLVCVVCLSLCVCCIYEREGTVVPSCEFVKARGQLSEMGSQILPLGAPVTTLRCQACLAAVLAAQPAILLVLFLILESECLDHFLLG